MMNHDDDRFARLTRDLRVATYTLASCACLSLGQHDGQTFTVRYCRIPIRYGINNLCLVRRNLLYLLELARLYLVRDD